MASILSLLIHCWVPISIIEDNIAGSCKIQSYSSRPGTAYEAEHLRIIVESLYYSLPQLSLCISI